MAFRTTLLLGLLVAAGCSTPPTMPTGPSSSTAPFSSSSAVARVEPSAAGDDPSLPDGWQLVWPGDADGPAARLSAVVATPAGFTVVGTDLVAHHGVALDSVDGGHWTVAPVPSRFGGPNAVIGWGDRLLATGGGEARCAHPSGADTWVRAADGTWTEAPESDLLCNGLTIQPMIVDGLAIAVGSGPGDNPIAWSSDDGLRWIDRGAPLAGLLPQGVTGDGSSAFTVAWSDRGIFASTSDDGITWTEPVPIAGLPADLHVEGVFVRDGRPTIVATVGGVAGLIHLDDSGAWTTTRIDAFGGDDLRTIRPIPGGLLAIGSTERGGFAWVSADGTSWRPVALPMGLADAGGAVADVAIRDGRAVVLGGVTNPASGATSGEIWLGRASLLAP